MRHLKISWLLIALFLLILSPAQTQDEITPFRIGRGNVEAVQWHPQGLYVMVSSVTGAWIYTDTLEDVTHIPDLQLADITPDGQYITGTVDGQTIQFWDAHTFEFVKAYQTDVRRIAALEWSPDSRYLAVGNHGDDLFQILDFDPNQVSSPYLHASNIHGDKLAWSVDGHYLAIMNIETAEVHVWDNIQREYTIYDKPEYGEQGISLMWDRCNYLMRQQYSENPISTVWNMNNGDVIEKKYLGWHATVSPADCSHYSAGYIDNMTTYDAKEIEADFLPHNVSSVGWKPDGTQIALSEWAYQSEPRSLWIVDVGTASIIQEIPTQDQSMREIVWHPYSWLSYFVTVGRDNQLTAYHLDNSNTGYTITGTQDAHAQVGDVFEWNPANSSLAIANQANGAGIWDVQSEANIANYRYEDKTITNLDWSADGDNLAMMISSGYGYQAIPEVVAILDKRSEQVQYVDMLPTTAEPVDFDWHPTELQLAVAGDGQASIWDQNTQEIVKDIPRDGMAMPGIQWSPDGELLAVPIFTSRGMVAIINAESSESSIGASTFATAWSWSSNNKVIWFSWDFNSCGGGARSPIIEPELRTNWEQSTPLVGMTKEVRQGFISPNGTYGIALDEDGNGLIWDIHTTDVMAMLSDVKNLAWSPNESKLAIQRTDNALMILSPTGQVLEYLPPKVSFTPRNRYAGKFDNLKWSTGGTYLAQYHDGVIDVWTLGQDAPANSEQNLTSPALDLSDMGRVILSLLIAISGMIGLKWIHSAYSQRSFNKRKRN